MGRGFESLRARTRSSTRLLGYSGECLIVTDSFEPRAYSEIDAKPDLIGWPVRAPIERGPTTERGIGLREFLLEATLRSQRIHELHWTRPFKRDAMTTDHREAERHPIRIHLP